jgi:hypothetical protein
MKTLHAGALSRREMLKAASLGATAGALTAAGAGAAALPSVQASAAQEVQVGKDPGKHEPLENFKYDLENSKGWVGEAGSAKEVTIEEFPTPMKAALGLSAWHCIESDPSTGAHQV